MFVASCAEIIFNGGVGVATDYPTMQASGCSASHDGMHQNGLQIFHEDG